MNLATQAPSPGAGRRAVGTAGRRWVRRAVAAAAVALVGSAIAARPARTQQPQPSGRNVIIFVADGLRPGSVNPVDAPTMTAVRQAGVFFANSHSIFPTFTTPNSAAIGTGHYPGDTGDFSNTIFVGYPVASNGSATPFIESDPNIGDLDNHFNPAAHNFLNEETLLSLARKNGYHTAAVGKVGPALIQDASQGAPVHGVVPVPQTVVIDDSTGHPGGIPLGGDIAALLNAAGLGTVAPTRGANGVSGNSTTPGTSVPNVVQQQYFVDSTTKVILPYFRSEGGPFALVYWSRDADGTQHNQGDSLNSLVPGINGPTSRAAVKNADNNLAQILAYLDANPELAANTDVVVTADHGFATISKHDLDASGANFTRSYAASRRYVTAAGAQDVVPGYLPAGFLAIDLAHALNLPLFDPDSPNSAASPTSYLPVDPTQSPTAAREQHPRSGNALIGGTGTVVMAGTPPAPTFDATAVVAANGGSDLVYIPSGDPAVLQNVVNILLAQDYVSGLFVDDKYGAIAGTLPISAINLKGATNLPTPAVVVNFRTFSTDATNPLQTGVEIADSTLQHGQGMHGTFGRQDTFMNMAAIGPDFKSSFVMTGPASNADIAPTLLAILNIQAPSHGMLKGRVLAEALLGGPDQLPVSAGVSYSPSPSPDGLRTYLAYQQVGPNRYFDAAGFAGRTINLPVLAGTAAGQTLMAGSSYLLLDGAAGNDILVGGSNRVTMIGGPGPDTFVIAPTTATVTVADFVAGDKIGLNGVTYAQLLIRAGTGVNAGNSLIYQARTGRLLAILDGVAPAGLPSSVFVPYP